MQYKLHFFVFGVPSSPPLNKNLIYFTAPDLIKQRCAWLKAYISFSAEFCIANAGFSISHIRIVYNLELASKPNFKNLYVLFAEFRTINEWKSTHGGLTNVCALSSFYSSPRIVFSSHFSIKRCKPVLQPSLSVVCTQTKNFTLLEEINGKLIYNLERNIEIITNASSRRILKVTFMNAIIEAVVDWKCIERRSSWRE